MKYFIRKFSFVLVMAGVLALGGCASTQKVDDAKVMQSDEVSAVSIFLNKKIYLDLDYKEKLKSE